MNLAFDLDGTLVDTRHANLVAYRSVGVEPPEDFHVRDWREWCSPHDHDRKGEVVGGFLREHMRALPLLELYRASGGLVLSNCSAPVARTVTSLLRARGVSINIEWGLTGAQKVRRLIETSAEGVYADDSRATIELVKRRTRWQTLLVT